MPPEDAKGEKVNAGVRLGDPKQELAPQVGFEPTTLRLTEQELTYYQILTRNGRPPEALIGNAG